MVHVDHTLLAEMALGEPSAEDRRTAERHLDGCPHCRDELEALRRVVTAARTASPADMPAPPPERVWDAIAAELDLGAETGPDALAETVLEAGPKTAAEPRPAPGTGPGTEPRTDPDLGSGSGSGAAASASPSSGPAGADRAAGSPAVVPARLRSAARRTLLLVAAACLVLGAGVGSGITWWQVREDAPAVDAGRPATLDPLATVSADGTARVDRLGPADRQLRIDVGGLPPTRGYFEVWLMDRSHTKLVSIGVLGPDGSATLPLPDNVDFREYALVDVSEEPYNGSPGHSGKSVVRGQLRL